MQKEQLPPACCVAVVADTALVPDITCPDVQSIFKEWPDVLVASELPTPSPPFQMNAAGTHRREKPDMETRPNTPWFH